MSTYEELKGLKVKYLSSDTSGDRIQEGEVFYNSSDFNLKSFVTTAAWHSSGALITARQSLGGIGTQTANLAVGGYVSAESTLVEEYNGTGWATGGALPAARNSGGAFGTQTSGVYAGGGVSPNSTATNSTQEYDGSSWTNGGNLNTSRDQTSGAGTETAGLCCGGTPNGSAQSNTSEEYNGSAWTAGNNLSFAARSVHNSSLGIQTAALLVGGNSDGATSGVQSYNGTTWTAGTALPAARFTLATSGTQTAGMAFGGNDGSNIKNTSFNFDGSSWTATPNLATARDNLGGSPSGSNTTSVAVGGRQPGPANSSLTEEFTVSLSATTAGAWSSGGNTGIAGQAASPVAGTQTAGSIVGRNQGPPSWYSNVTQHYDGSSWTNGGNYPTAGGYLINEGTQTAAVAAINGYYNGSSFLTPTASNEYDGSSWTSTGSIGTARYGAAGFGTQTAAMGVCGSIVPANSVVNSESYDGSSWTAGPNAVNERQRTTGTGIQTAGLVGSGYSNTPSPESDNYASAANIEEFDGSSFSNSGGSTHSSWQQGCFGTASSAIFFGGNTSSVFTTATAFDGTSSFTSPSMTVTRSGGGGGGTTTAGLAASGGAPNFTAPMVATEEWTGETTAARAVKTIDFD